MINRHLSLTLLVSATTFLSGCTQAHTATSFSGNVVAITDGDTIVVLSGSTPEKIRLAEIDCPEKRQAFGQQAKEYCSQLCFGKTVTVTYSAHDRDKRIIGYVTLPDGHQLNSELVKAGMAWCYPKYCKHQDMYDSEKHARDSKIGLWQDPDSIPPWQWRKESRQHSKDAANQSSTQLLPL